MEIDWIIVAAEVIIILGIMIIAAKILLVKGPLVVKLFQHSKLFKALKI